MDVHMATEIAYKNGFSAGQKSIWKNINKEFPCENGYYLVCCKSQGKKKRITLASFNSETKMWSLFKRPDTEVENSNGFESIVFWCNVPKLPDF